ncbi:hypothetical protein [Micromonospora sp. WMMD1155]|uniref:hypothetical protein n=1 Tax=Micromonospora sp. WMMD1155 TaxID=3016094 RepID=UPI00249BC12C|nr:hypothetical protein [Micromonospora sp. WMMD1155]WFE49887.1 hypothetical protein O7617_05955 [Micromonospora sp. WMMD1155]
MSSFFRRKAAAVTFAVLALSLAGGGIAVAQPSAKAPQEAVQPAARGTNAQPPVTAESARMAKAALKANSTLVASTTIVVVNSNGTKARGTGTVIKYGVGQYEVQFGHNVTAGVFVATVGRADACCIPPAGEIAVAPRLSTPNAVFVQTRTSAGVPTDLGFHLVVHLS